jgi:glutaminyl-peptide cyclotransferase
VVFGRGKLKTSNGRLRNPSSLSKGLGKWISHHSARSLIWASGITVGIVLWVHCRGAEQPSPDAGWAALAGKTQSQEGTPFDGERAYRYLTALCELGPRFSGSPGMGKQQKLLEEHFSGLGGRVHFQRFRAPHPLDRTPVNMANLIVEWFPERLDRVLLCAHYDTLPYPMLDPRDPKGTFLGANDGASGVAVLMELGHHIQNLNSKLGLDFAFFDAEEFIFRETDPYFLGSEFFSQAYREDRLPYKAQYRCAILLDMVGDADLQIYQERNSLSWPESRPLVQEIWGVARRLGVREFIPRPKYDIRDDHLMLRNVGRIPACVTIDFDYPYWHTTEDTPDKCSARSLAIVGHVLMEWIKGLK